MPSCLPAPLSGVRGVIFDLDGTLVDSYEAIATSVNAARAAFNLEPLEAEEIRRRVGRGLEALMADVLGPGREDVGAQIFRERYAQVFAGSTRPLENARETLKALHERGYRLTVASNKLARFGKPILEQFGMARWIVSVEGPDTAGAVKPDPAMIRRCLRAMGVERQEALYVGDMLLDVETASRAGVGVVLVHGGSSNRAELLDTGAPVLESLSGLLDLLPPLGGVQGNGDTP